ncbi:LuxR C-terminal-related transcriptional regulator [Ammoniphilus sp. 3BR4]|uniref:helix-turn-helix transcriptional regulator n=1 Tax=Ammoniphilus sp. 3BR4 TaxID=3158265 RepID=UPI0034668F9F
MSYPFTIQEHVKKLMVSGDQEDLIIQIIETYMKLFPVLNAHLFRYSPFGYLAEGIISLSSSGLAHIRDNREDIRSLPGILAAIRERKAKYYSGIDYMKLSSKYILAYHSLMILPICHNSVVIGYIISSNFKEEAEFDEKLLSSLTLFGNLIGKVLYLSNASEKQGQLSKRELEVMQRVSWGESSKEIADSLKISEPTVKQYVQSAIKKLGAQNRTQAVAELLRKGIIS